MIGLILAAAGSGSRFGSQTPKQFLPLEGRPLYQASLIAFDSRVDQAVLVVPPDWAARVESEISRLPLTCEAIVEAGGTERQDSVYRGLLRLRPEIEFVLVHDAARPYVSEDLIARVVESMQRDKACIPALPVSETVKEVAGPKVLRTLDRTRLRLVQTPQGFERNLLKAAFEKAIKEGFCGTDESTLVERLGEAVHVVAGDPGNIKVTWKDDLVS